MPKTLEQAPDDLAVDVDPSLTYDADGALVPTMDETLNAAMPTLPQADTVVQADAPQMSPERAAHLRMMREVRLRHSSGSCRQSIGRCSQKKNPAVSCRVFL